MCLECVRNRLFSQCNDKDVSEKAQADDNGSFDSFKSPLDSFHNTGPQYESSVLSVTCDSSVACEGTSAEKDDHATERQCSVVGSGL